MTRRHSVLFGFVALFLASLACNAFAPGGTEPGFDLPPPAVSDLTGTPAPSEPTIEGLAPTATLPGGSSGGDTGGDGGSGDGGPTVRVLVDLNVRRGPGVQYDRVGFLLQNETAPIIGFDPASGWWKIVCPPRVDEITECWISGGSQYSDASNAQGVPIAAVPPTPTPQPTPTATSTPGTDQGSGSGTPSPNSSFVIYTTSDGLYRAALDTSQSPPAFGTVSQLVTNPTIGTVAISPNGAYVAYTAGVDQNQQLRLVDLATGRDSLLVSGSELDSNPSDSLATAVDNVSWLENSQAILFNTTIFNLTGPGTGSLEDLQSVSLNGVVSELFSEGTFAGEFAVSGNRVIGGRSDAVVIATIGSDTVTTLLTFPLINTASEYIFYPQAQWISGSTAYVAIPSEAPFEQETFKIWQLSDSGSAVPGPDLPGLALFDSVRWSPNGSRLAYIDVVSEPGTPFLMIANGDGQNAAAYDSGENLQLYRWSPNGRSLLYSGNGFYAASVEGGSPVDFLVADAVLDMQWIENDKFIAAVGVGGQWNLVTNTVSGQSSTVSIVNDDFITFDVWSP